MSPLEKGKEGRTAPAALTPAVADHSSHSEEKCPSSDDDQEELPSPLPPSSSMTEPSPPPGLRAAVLSSPAVAKEEQEDVGQEEEKKEEDAADEPVAVAAATAAAALGEEKKDADADADDGDGVGDRAERVGLAKFYSARQGFGSVDSAENDDGDLGADEGGGESSEAGEEKDNEEEKDGEEEKDDKEENDIPSDADADAGAASAKLSISFADDSKRPAGEVTAKIATATVTPDSRDLLQQEAIELRRCKSLTVREFNFLEDIVARGNEEEVQAARRKLADQNLFFVMNEESFGYEVKPPYAEEGSDDGEGRKADIEEVGEEVGEVAVEEEEKEQKGDEEERPSTPAKKNAADTASIRPSISTSSNAGNDASSGWMENWVKASPTSSRSFSSSPTPRDGVSGSISGSVSGDGGGGGDDDDDGDPPSRSASPRGGVLNPFQCIAVSGDEDSNYNPQTSVVFGEKFGSQKFGSRPLKVFESADSFLDEESSAPQSRGRSRGSGGPYCREASVSTNTVADGIEVELEGGVDKRGRPADKLRDKKGESIGTIELDEEEKAAIAAAVASAAAPPAAAVLKAQDTNAYNSLACASTSVTAGHSSFPSLHPGPIKEQRQRSQSVGSAVSGLSVGSNERLLELESRRREQSLHGSLWRAHESGLALTKEASRSSASLKNLGRSPFRRRSKGYIVDVYGTVSGAQQQPPPPSPSGRRDVPSPVLGRGRSSSVGQKRHSRESLVSRDSFLSTATLDLLEHGGPTDRFGESQIFRREEGENSIFRIHAAAGPPFKAAVVRRGRSVSGGSNGAQSRMSSLSNSGNSNTSQLGNSITAGAVGQGVSSAPVTVLSEFALRSRSPSPANLSIGALKLDDLGPPSGPHKRTTSIGSRVTFADEDVSASGAGADNADLRGAALKLLPPGKPAGSALRRRSSRDFSPMQSRGVSAMNNNGKGDVGRGHSPARRQSSSSRRQRAKSATGRILLPPSLSSPQQQRQSRAEARHHRYIRSESLVSVGSIPSLHHGTPVRSDSIVSVASVLSIPSIRHAHPLRSDSVLSGRSATSAPGIQHGNLVWSDSVLSGRSQISVPSLRPAAPLRSDSMESSVLSFGSGTDLDIIGARAQSPAIAENEVFRSSATEMAPPDITSSPRLPSGAQPDRPPMPPKPPQAQGAQGTAPPVLARPRPVKPVMMRRASRNAYEGEGIEVSELDSNTSSTGMGPEVTVTVEDARKYGSMISSAMGEESAGADVTAMEDEGVDRNDEVLAERDNEERDAVAGYGDGDSANEDGPINPFWLNADDGSVVLTAGGLHDDGFVPDSGLARRTIGMVDVSVFARELKRSLSDDGLVQMAAECNSDDDCLGSYNYGDDDASWDLKSEPDGVVPQQDAWNVLKDEYAVGYGAGGALPFLILGTSADDEMSHPHVLSPPLMESLQCFFPYTVSEDNFWMKFSMVRDGASLHTMLQNVRGTQHTIIAIETVEGEVFGSFTSAPWRKNWNYFGTGESFLWRLRENRHSAKCHSVIDQAQLESELDVYPWTGENNFVQLCTHDKIAVGGGSEREAEAGRVGSPLIPTSPASPASPTSPSSSDERKSSWEEKEDVSFGFGIAIDSDLLHGTSNPCLTFSSPSLSQLHGDGNTFEILNLEVWTLTPCISVEEAEKMELGRLFLESQKED